MRLDRRLRRPGALLGSVLALLAAAPAAHAASVAYIDQGSVWLASLDGAQRVKIADPVVTSSGETEPWLDVAQSDGGRIVAARNFPGRISRFSSFKIWEPDGTSVVEGPLNAPSGWSTYAYPLGFDITADGRFLVYGYSNSGACCPIPFDQGYYARSATNSALDPIAIDKTHPALVGSRAVALDGSFDPTTVWVQQAGGGNPFNPEFAPWLDTSMVGLDLDGVDVAADGRLLALDFEQYDAGTQTVGKIAVVSAQGLDQPVAFPAAVDCFMPATGIARAVSLSPDGASIAWQDGSGVRVAGTPTTVDDPCIPSRPTVTISATGKLPSIGGADVARFLPAPPPPPGTPAVTAPAPGTAPSGTAPATTAATAGTTAAPAVSLPARVTARALLSSRGLPIRVRVRSAGRVVARATVPAKRLGRRGAPVVVATGTTTARAAGTVTVRLRRTAVARRNARRLRGARLTVRVTHGGRSTVRTATLR